MEGINFLLNKVITKKLKKGKGNKGKIKVERGLGKWGVACSHMLRRENVQ